MKPKSNVKWQQNVLIRAQHNRGRVSHQLSDELITGTYILLLEYLVLMVAVACNGTFQFLEYR